MRHAPPVPRLPIALGLGLALLLPAAARTAAPQEGGGDGERPQEAPPVSGMQTTPAQEEMLRLFGEVERNLRATDLLLWNASTGEVPLAEPEDSGLADLLRDAQSRGRQTTEGIDRILEIARQQSQQSQSSQSNQPPPPSPSQSQQGQSPPSPRENTPEAGEQQPTPPHPEGQDEPKPDGQEHPDPQDANDQGPMRQEETGPRAAAGDEADRWGELPQRVRELFRTEGGGDVPAQYRDWIDAYYRRLNRVR